MILLKGQAVNDCVCQTQRDNDYNFEDGKMMGIRKECLTYVESDSQPHSRSDVVLAYMSA